MLPWRAEVGDKCPYCSGIFTSETTTTIPYESQSKPVTLTFVVVTLGISIPLCITIRFLFPERDEPVPSTLQLLSPWIISSVIVALTILAKRHSSLLRRIFYWIGRALLTFLKALQLFR